MTEQITPPERRGRSANLINNMLEERRQLLALLLDVSAINAANPQETDLERLDEFCQVLVDYIAATHFGLYERIVEGKERRKSVSALAVNVYPTIEKTTEAVLAFTEKYDLGNGSADLSDLHTELSRLSELLTTRIEQEDDLINEMLSGGEKN